METGWLGGAEPCRVWISLIVHVGLIGTHYVDGSIVNNEKE